MEITLDISDPRAYCGFVAAQHAQMLSDSMDTKFVSPAMFIAKHGVIYAPKFGRCRRGKIKECFSNATRLAMEDERITYVEGWAASDVGLAVEHAWCVSPTGKVLEPTWRGDGMPRGMAYFGVPVPTPVLRKVAMVTGNCGVFSQWFNWEEILAILKREKPEWFEEAKQ